ncbi:MAG: glycosyltransferase [Lachnospira sp.]|nr:glycosyltransferase [Lachnospira sp.]
MSYKDGDNSKNGLSDIRKAVDNVKKYGVVNGTKKSIEESKLIKFDYEEYRKKNEPSYDILEQQKREGFIFEPLISVLLLVKNRDSMYARETLESILKQTYHNVELCVLTTKENEQVKRALDEFCNDVHKINYICADEIVNYSQGMNKLLERANGDFVALVDCNDIITPDAIYENVRMLNKNERVDVVYSDEDYFNSLGEYFSPMFKTAYNLDLLRSCNYIGNLFMVRKSTADRVGGFDESYDCEQKYDFIFRCIEQSENTKHVPKVLYHNRVLSNEDVKLTEYRNTIKKIIIEEHLRRKNIVAEVEPTEHIGMFRINYRLLETPKVTVVIDKKGSDAQLKACINSIKTHTIYRNYEIVVRYDSNVRVSTDAEYVLLLDSTMRVTTSNFIEIMLARIVQGDAGIVAGKIVDKNNRICYAGIRLNKNQVKYLFRGMPMWQEGYCCRAILQQDVDAAPIYGIMLKKDDYEDMSKGEIVDNVDVKLIYKIRKSKRFVMFEPNVIFKN